MFMFPEIWESVNNCNGSLSQIEFNENERG